MDIVFDENKLHEEIIRVFGAYGWHAEVYADLLFRLHLLEKQASVFETQNINLKTKFDMENETLIKNVTPPDAKLM